MKKETKEKLKNIWLENSPYLAVLGVACAGLVLSFDKSSKNRDNAYIELQATRRADSIRAADAYVSTLERQVEILENK